MPGFYTVDQTWPSRQFNPEGTVYRFVKTRLREALVIADAHTPRRTGELALHNYTEIKRIAALRTLGTLGNDSAHAVYVHDGTIGPIFHSGPRAMPIPKARGGLPWRATHDPKLYFRSRSVRGQAPQPWLLEAAEAVFH